MIMALLCSTIVRAQDTTSLSGTVTDPQGKVLSGATVTITNPATGASRETKTGEDGSFTFSQIPPATYSVRVEAKGFKIQHSRECSGAGGHTKKHQHAVGGR